MTGRIPSTLLGGFFAGLVIFLGLSLAETDDILPVAKFSASEAGGMLPPGWEPLTFSKIKKHTEYAVVKNDKTSVVKAVSQGSSSGLIRHISIDLKEYPIVEWRWKVENILEKGDVSRKEGDDYPARLYITFEYDSEKVGLFEKAKYEAAKLVYGEYPPGTTINYIWESKSPVGTVVPNPYTDRVRMIVTQSGPEKLNQWVTEEHNLYEDYKQAFGGGTAKNFWAGDHDRHRQYQRVHCRLLWRYSIQKRATEIREKRKRSSVPASLHLLA